MTDKMEVVLDPERKDTYDKCRYKVKLWEHQFKKKNGRLPSKLDIREASKEVRNAYKTYFRLKTAALEESLMHIEGFDTDIDKCNDSAVEKQAVAREESTNTLEQPDSQNLVPSIKVNTNDTWGVHLNNNPVKQSKPKIEKLTVNLTFSKKLFAGSKSSKRLPRKSLSFTRKKSELDMSRPQFLSQPETSSSFTDNPEPPLFLKDCIDFFRAGNVKTVVPASAVSSQPVNIVQNIVSNNNFASQPLRTLDVGWVQRVTQNTGTDFLNNDLTNLDSHDVQGNLNIREVDYDSDDVIGNSEDEQDNSCSLYHIAKKRRTLDNISVQNINQSLQKTDTSNSLLLTIDTVPKRLDFSNLFGNGVLKTQNVDDRQSNVSENISSLSNNLKIDSAAKKPVDIYEFDSEEQRQGENVQTVRTKRQSEKATVKDTDENTVSRKSGRIRKTLVDLSQQMDTENEDPFHSDNDMNDPEFSVGNNNNKCLGFLDENDNSKQTKKQARVKPSSRSKKTENTKRKRSPRGKIHEQQEESESLLHGYELEYSIKPRIVTVPRIKNIKQIIVRANKSSSVPETESTSNASEAVSNRTNRAQEKLKKKVESGTLNDNYVQINLKKKIYVRGKNTKTFSRYKKQQWKNKKNALYGPNMDMGGCDGGILTCFNCGQVGHFARNCRAAKSDALLPLQEEEELCPYPTLEEAAKMAQESVLAIRKPNKTQKEEHKSEKDVEDIENDSAGSGQVDDQNGSVFDSDDDELLAETERLEEQIAKIDVQNYIDLTTHVKPYYSVAEDGNLIETPQEVFDTLRKFGHQTFRDGQEQAIMRILSGKSTLVTLSTGSGKSLCYQLPAYLYSQREPCISLIISPLVSLMEDQVTGIPAFLKAACLHTNQTRTQREKTMEAISSGTLNVLLVSPEAVVAGERSLGFGSLLRRLPPIAFACIDEAHCVSQWSHNFRPSYLKICHVLRDRLGVNTVLGLTATATRATSDSIIRHLCIPDGREGIISDTPLPDNLRLTVSCDIQRDQALLALLLSERFADCRSIIVYCTRREECQRVATFLRTCLKKNELAGNANKKRKRYSLQAEAYHAGMSASRRKSIQKAFMSGDLRIVVATVAFGMGINKADIRAVIHYNMPMSFESYVQEVGRAGRDGLPAHCHLFLDSQGKDENELRRHIYANSTDRHAIRKLLQRCFIPCSCKTSCPRHEVAFSIEETVQALDIPEENIETLLCYLELHDKRYIELLSHAYTSCKIISYGGPNEIRKAAKECPPLAMALALHQKDSKEDNIFEFPVVEVASAMGWDSGICKHKLKNLEWFTENGQPKRSKLNVQFANLGFRLLAPGNLSESTLDEALDSLFERVREQERTSLLQLHAVHATLTAVATPSFKTCISNKETIENEKSLKAKIREYFESPKPLDLLPEIEVKTVKEDQVVSDIRSLVCMYRDNSFTGRAVARIFHGVQSPNYPAFIWGRCKFWRAHMGTDFNVICQIATREILRMR